MARVVQARQKGKHMNNTAKTVLCGLVAATCVMLADTARADRVSFGLGIGDGVNFFSLGVNSRASTCYGPRPVVVAPPPVVYVQPAPIVYTQPAPVVYAQQPAAVVYAQPGGYWVEADNRVWVEGLWIDFTDAWGRHGRRQQPGHWETRHIREWRQPAPGGNVRPGSHFDGRDRHDQRPQGNVGGRGRHD